MLLLLRSSQAPAEITGSATLALGAFTSSAAGTVDVQGATDVTLGPLSLTSAGTVDVIGAGALNLTALSIVAAGTVGIDGQAPIVLGPIVLAASGTVAIDGGASLTVAMGIAADGTVGSPPLDGVLSLSLDAMSCSATGYVYSPTAQSQTVADTRRRGRRR